MGKHLARAKSQTTTRAPARGCPYYTTHRLAKLVYSRGGACPRPGSVARAKSQTTTRAPARGCPYYTTHRLAKLVYSRGGACPRPGKPPTLVRSLLLLLCLLLASCSLGGGNVQPTRMSTPTATSQPVTVLSTPSPESLQNLLQTEQLLLMTPHPLRDL